MIRLTKAMVLGKCPFIIKTLEKRWTRTLTDCCFFYQNSFKYKSVEEHLQMYAYIIEVYIADFVYLNFHYKSCSNDI